MTSREPIDPATTLVTLKANVESVLYELKLQTLYFHQRNHMINRLVDSVIRHTKRK
jgi:hypothetical protein